MAEDNPGHAMQVAEIIEEQIAFTKEYEPFGAEIPIWQNPVGVLTATEREVHADGVVIRSSLDPGLEVYADPMLRKVFFNLLDNAIRHGERVTEVRESAMPSSGNLVIVWEDNGMGIVAGEKGLIFERGCGKNTGLGMFLARDIPSLTGSTIRAAGEPGEGARLPAPGPPG
ncbi:HAMP domain-containing sensor histidine kinase, partial [Methanoregula sp.]|uniref:sensor histidine kinase n=1 Tax=Methanoregula sp. TaxID=2052170 RepID=UPI000CAA0821